MHHLASSTNDHAGLPAIAGERRASHRTRTVYRIARVHANDDEGLGRIRDISDEGMKVSLGIPVTLGDTVSVALSDTLTLDGRVVWTNGEECGLKFAAPIDSIDVLHRTAEAIRSGEARAPRLATGLRAVVASERGLRAARISDVSQRGMKVVHDGSFTPGLSVKVTLASGLQRRGVVRWVRDSVAGLMLTEPFSIQDLRSVSAL